MSYYSFISVFFFFLLSFIHTSLPLLRLRESYRDFNDNGVDPANACSITNP